MKTQHNLYSLEEAYVYATEVNLATLEQLLTRKSSSKSDIRRQRGICIAMLENCRSWCDSEQARKAKAVDWGHERHPYFPRVRELLNRTDVNPETALDEHSSTYATPAVEK